MSPAKILVVEDDSVSRELLVSYFSDEGYEVFSLESGEQGEETVREENIDLCMIDIKLPGVDGLTLAKKIRGFSPEVGIIMVTSKDDIIDKIVGLESGADDYVTKPFEPRELLSRVKNLLRRKETFQGASRQESSSLNFRGWNLDLGTRKLTPPEGGPIVLSEGEYMLLSELVKNSGQLLTRDEIMKRIRNREWHPDDRYVDVLVVKLRQKLKRFSPDETFIRTVHGKGYIFDV